jgi:hypothetical protein
MKNIWHRSFKMKNTGNISFINKTLGWRLQNEKYLELML